MARYIFKRLLQSAVTILLVVTVVFLLLRLMPTDYYFTDEENIKLTDQQKRIACRAPVCLIPLLRSWCASTSSCLPSLTWAPAAAFRPISL